MAAAEGGKSDTSLHPLEWQRRMHLTSACSANSEQESYFYAWVLHGLLFLEDVEYLGGCQLCQDHHVVAILYHWQNPCDNER